MKFEQIVISRHAFTKMFELNIPVEIVKRIATDGEIIKSYDDDKPFPSYLCLGFFHENPIHVVAANNEKMKTCIIVTAYVPDPSLWNSDFKTKIKKV